MKDFKRILNIGKFKQFNGTYYGNVYVKVEYKNKRLSISGVESPQSNGNARGCAGQIVDELKNIDKYNEYWNVGKVNALIAIWNEYHLNDMQPGTKKQMDYLKENNIKERDYTTVCDILKTANLYNDNGNKYGCAWYRKDVPEDVLKWLYDLEKTKESPYWV